MQESHTAAESRRPRLGLVAQVAGALGVVLCVLLIAGLWFGRGWIGDAADSLTAAAEQATARAIAVSDTAISGLEAHAQEVDAVEASARQLATDPSATSAALDSITARLTPVARAYAATRDKYVGLREGVATALDTLQRLDRLVRQVDIPDSLGSSLAAIDERLAAIDTALTGVTRTGAAVTGVSVAATAVADQAAALSEAFRAAEDVGRSVQAGLAEVQAELTGAAQTLDELAGYGAIALTVFLAWVILLNIALWALGRRWRAT